MRAPVRRALLRIASVISLLASAAGIQLAGAAPLHAVPQNVNVSRWLGNQTETTVAVNPTNPDNVVILSNTDTGTGLFKAYSTDGGQTWTADMIGDGDNLGFACCDPSASFDEFGNLFLVYLKSRGPGLPIALSTDGGATFEVAALLEREEGTIAHLGPGTREGEEHGFAPVDQPTLTTGAGSVWVTYKFFDRKQYLRNSGAQVTGLGQVGPFILPEPAPGSGGGSFGDIAIGPEGQVMITYQDHTSGEGPSDIFVNVDPDGLGPEAFGPRVFAAHTNVGGFDYIPAQSLRSVDAESGLAWDRSGGPHTGRVYLVYTNEATPERNDLDILVRISDDEGATWSESIRVNDDAARNSQFLPRIALDQTNGAVGVAFHDARNDLGQGAPYDTDRIRNTDAQLYAAFLDTAGLSFGPNVQVSAGTSNARRARSGIDYGDYIGLAFFEGVLRPAWADNSNSTGDNPRGALRRFDVYTAAVPAP